MANFLKIPAKLEYGLILMIFLAKDYKEGKTLSLESISQKTNISQGYLEEIAFLLKKKNLVSSKRGLGGGYALSRKPKDIKIYDLVEALTGPLWLVKCLGDDVSGSCVINKKFAKGCPTKSFWRILQKSVNQSLKTAKLSQLA